MPETYLKSSVLALTEYIHGLKMVWNSNTELAVTNGAAYVPSLGRILNVNNTLTVTPTVTTSTWYHVYLYRTSPLPNVYGPALDVSTTAPEIYSGTARQKTGDNSRRYLGSFKTDGSGNIINFRHNPIRGQITYQVQNDVSPFRVLSAGTSTTEATVGTSAVVPVTGFSVLAKASNTASNTTALIHIGNSLDSIPTLGGSGYGGILIYVNIGYQTFLEIPLDNSQNFTYAYYVAPVGGGAYFDVYGYFFER